jgi:hypothetical protein
VTRNRLKQETIMQGTTSSTPPQHAYIHLAVDVLAALPALLRAAGYAAAADAIGEQIAADVTHEGRAAYVDAAREIYDWDGGGEVAIDDNAVIARGDRGAYVMA